MSKAIAIPIVIATVAALGAIPAAAKPPGTVFTQQEQQTITPAEALSRLKQGNERFTSGKSHPRDWRAEVKASASGQYPYAVVLGCVDSRVPVEVVFDQGLGSVFSPRVAGNFVTDELLGSVEFATKVAGAKLVVVLGHTSCGAVKGACADVQLGHIHDLVEEIQPSVAAVAGETCDAKNDGLVDEIATHNVQRNVAQMRARSKILRDLEREGNLMIVGGMYDLATGKVAFHEGTPASAK